MPFDKQNDLIPAGVTVTLGETVPVSDPLALAHRQLQDATEREYRLLARIAQLEEQNRIYTHMLARQIQQQQVPYVVPRYAPITTIHDGTQAFDCTAGRGNFMVMGNYARPVTRNLQRQNLFDRILGCIGL